MRERPTRPAFEVGSAFPGSTSNICALAGGAGGVEAQHLAKPLHFAFLSAGVRRRYMKFPGEISLRMRYPTPFPLSSRGTGHQTKQRSHSIPAVNQNRQFE